MVLNRIYKAYGIVPIPMWDTTWHIGPWRRVHTYGFFHISLTVSFSLGYHCNKFLFMPHVKKTIHIKKRVYHCLTVCMIILSWPARHQVTTAHFHYVNQDTVYVMTGRCGPAPPKKNKCGHCAELYSIMSVANKGNKKQRTMQTTQKTEQVGKRTM